MSKRIISLLMLAIGVMIAALFNASAVSANSYPYISEDEVLRRAEVVVSGTYMLGGPCTEEKGCLFRIHKLFKGTVEEPFYAGVHGFDRGWVAQFQREDGEVLLLLEHDEDGRLWPVNMVSGIVRFTGGVPYDKNNLPSDAYIKFIKEHPGTVLHYPLTDSSWPLIAATLLLIGFLLVKRQLGRSRAIPKSR